MVTQLTGDWKSCYLFNHIVCHGNGSVNRITMWAFVRGASYRYQLGGYTHIVCERTDAQTWLHTCKGTQLETALSVASVVSTLCNSMNHSSPGSSVHGILQATILEWATMPTPVLEDPLQGTFPAQGSNPCLLHLQHLQPDSLPLAPPGIRYLEAVPTSNQALFLALRQLNSDEEAVMSLRS